jgi:hypothetical protein
MKRHELTILGENGRSQMVLLDRCTVLAESGPEAARRYSERFGSQAAEPDSRPADRHRWQVNPRLAVVLDASSCIVVEIAGVRATVSNVAELCSVLQAARADQDA